MSGVIMLVVLMIASFAQAEPIRLFSSRPQGNIVLVQNTSGDSWHSPSTLSDDFPRLAPSDCLQYGARYGYAECGGVRAKSTLPQKAKPIGLTQNPATIAKALPARASQISVADIPPTPQKTGPRHQAIKRMIGQLLVVGFDGKRATDLPVTLVRTAIEEGRIGGVLLRPGNVESFTQVQNLVAHFRQSNPSLPPLIAVEQPGGSQTTFSDGAGFSFYAPANTVSGDNQPYFAQLLYRDLAMELATLGVNINIGPSVDVCPEETLPLSAICFSSDPRQVNVFATAFNYGHNERGVLTALKHTPFNQGLQSASFYRKASGAIFRELTKRRPSDSLVIAINSLDQLRKPVLVGQTGSPQGLRQDIRDLGYDGALIFDLDFVNRGGPVRYDEAIVSALEAGADMVLLRDISNLNGDISAIALESVNRAVESGRLPLSRLEDAAQNVRRLKDRFISWQREAQNASRAQPAIATP